MLKRKKRTRQKTAKKEQQFTSTTVLSPSLSASNPTINYYIKYGYNKEIARQRDYTRFSSIIPNRSIAIPSSSSSSYSTNSLSNLVRENYTLKDYIN